MKVSELAQEIAAEVVTPGREDVRVEGVYAGDRVSDMLNHTGERVMLVSNVTGVQLARVAGLMDVPAICLVEGVEPGEAVIRAAKEHGTAVLVSPAGMYETCGRIYAALRPR